MITLKNVSKRYDNVPVLNEINLEINRGSFCCITGKSGAGKSTLLKIISGMEKPDEGQAPKIMGKAFFICISKLFSFGRQDRQEEFETRLSKNRGT